MYYQWVKTTLKLVKNTLINQKIEYIYNDQNQTNEKTIIYFTDFLFSYRFC
jgi:hypothetical protein